MKTILLFLAFLSIATYGQQLQQRVAILNTMDDSDSIKFSDLAFLTSRLRETAVNVLPKSQYGVMTTESIVAFLGSEERAIKICRESSCLAEIGRKVSADYVAQARLGKFGNDLSIKTELYDVKSGTLIGSFTGYSKDIYGLLVLIDEKAPDLFKKMPNALSDSSAPPPLIAFVAPQQDTVTPLAVTTAPATPIDNSYKNFTTGQRWGTWALNLTINGLGSYIIMDDVFGASVHFGLGVGLLVSTIMFYDDNVRCNFDGCQPKQLKRNSWGISLALFGSSGAIWNIYRSAIYDKPQNVANGKYEGFNFTVLPNRHGELMPYVFYSRGF